MYKILIIEDDLNIRSLIKQHLEKYGYSVHIFSDFSDNLSPIVKMICEGNFNLIILDINLPYMDGFHICKLIREKHSTPILMLSARDSTMDQIHGLHIGADDYMTKPFSLDHLTMKINALLRRSYGDYSQKKTHLNHTVLLNEKTYSLMYDGCEVEFTKTEFGLMELLYNNHGEIVTRNELIESLWECGMFIEDNTLTVNITRIKNKLKTVGLNDIIKTKRGIGYMILFKKSGDYDGQ